MKLITKSISVVTALCFCVGTITSPASAQLSAPVIPVKTGIQNQINFSEIPASAGMTNGVVFSGIKIYPQEPFRFDFIMDENNPTVRVTPRGYPDTGEHRGSSLQQDDMMRLIKYFMVSLTVPEGDLWVNLSPYEPDRIVPQALGQTEMGHDLLAQDYILKQLTASLMNPEGESGKKFWERVYEKLYASLSSPNVSVGDPFSKDMSSKNNGFPTEAFGNDSFQQAIESFNKVWIVPNRVEVYQNGDVAYITHADFKVMLEEDYYAKQQSELSSQRKLGPSVVQETAKDTGFPTETFGNDNIKQIIRQTIIPIIESEVNNGESFANLRQIFHSMILAKWYEQHFKNSVLGQNYVDHNTTSGIELEDKSAKQKIYDQYVQAYKSGVSNLIKEEYDPVTQGIVTRKYFVGGITANFAQLAVTSNLVMDSNVSVSRVSVFLKKEYPVSRSINYAMMSEKRHDMFISVLFLIFMGVILPYLEEYMFRDYLMNDPTSRATPYERIFYTSLMFGLVHIIDRPLWGLKSLNWRLMKQIFALGFTHLGTGLIFGFTSFFAGSYIYSWILHMMFNVFMMISPILFSEENYFKYKRGIILAAGSVVFLYPFFVYQWWGFIAGLSSFVFVGLLFRAFYKEMDNHPFRGLYWNNMFKRKSGVKAERPIREEKSYFSIADIEKDIKILRNKDVLSKQDTRMLKRLIYLSINYESFYREFEEAMNEKNNEQWFKDNQQHVNVLKQGKRLSIQAKEMILSQFKKWKGVKSSKFYRHKGELILGRFIQLESDEGIIGHVLLSDNRIEASLPLRSVMLKYKTLNGVVFLRKSVWPEAYISKADDILKENTDYLKTNLAMLDSVEEENLNPGGIDLNTLNMQTSGDVTPINFDVDSRFRGNDKGGGNDVKSDPAMFRPIRMLVPQILHIGTVNLGVFLGLNTNPPDAGSSADPSPELAAIKEET